MRSTVGASLLLALFAQATAARLVAQDSGAGPSPAAPFLPFLTEGQVQNTVGVRGSTYAAWDHRNRAEEIGRAHV